MTHDRSLLTIERALQLARGGKHRAVSEISSTLRREGFSSVDAHLSGGSIKAQLKEAMRLLYRQD